MIADDDDAKFELGWIPVPVSLGSMTEMEDSYLISIRRNIVRDNDERVYLSFGIDQGGGDDCGYDADKGVLKVNMRLLQMEEEELHETGGCFPLILASGDESLMQHTHINEGVLGKAVIVHMHYNKESKEDPRLKPKPKVQVQTFLIDLHESSLFRHGPTKFSINERQLLLNAVKVYAKNRGSRNDGAWYSKLYKYHFLSEHTGAEIEIRPPSMPPILLQANSDEGDLACYNLTPALSSTNTKRRSFEHLNNRSTSNFLYSPTKANGDGDGVVTTTTITSNYSDDNNDISWGRGRGRRDSAKPRANAKTKRCKKASFALDSDTSDDDGNQDEYEDDGFIVFGDVESSEDESENVESRPDSEERRDSLDSVGNNKDKDTYEDKDFCEVCHDGGNLLVCDGGPHMGGCGSAFHVNCIGKKEIPEGKIIL